MTFHSAISYARPEAPTRSLRSVEYDLLASISQRLRATWAGRATDFPALVGAVTDNTRLWSALASDVALPGNTLPAALRARLFYLYEFTATHSRAVLEGKASVEVLVDINLAVMRGLRGEGGPV
jgi:flagellar protein FlaF